MPKRKPGSLLPREVLLLKSLQAGPDYGFALSIRTEQLTSTVYAALKRLEAMGLVRSRWETPKAPPRGHPRRVYRLTAKGRRAV